MNALMLLSDCDDRLDVRQGNGDARHRRRTRETSLRQPHSSKEDLQAGQLLPFHIGNEPPGKFGKNVQQLTLLPHRKPPRENELLHWSRSAARIWRLSYATGVQPCHHVSGTAFRVVRLRTSRCTRGFNVKQTHAICRMRHNASALF